MAKNERTKAVEEIAADKEKGARKTIVQLVDNYDSLEKSLVAQLTMCTPKHGTTTGNNREMVWKDLFERIVPRKFCIDQGVFIIDSYGNISPEVDLAIFDEMYTPYVFQYGTIKFIPIEAVAVVVQCKSSDIDGAIEWAKRIAELKTSLDSVCRIMSGLVDNLRPNQKSNQNATRPIRILCAVESNLTDYSENKRAEKKNEKPTDCTEVFDIILNVTKGNLTKNIPNEKMNFEFWLKQLNCYDNDPIILKKENLEKYSRKQTEDKLERCLEDLIIKKNTEKIVMSLTFQLNQLLMLINNPMQFPHRAYVNMFNKTINEK